MHLVLGHSVDSCCAALVAGLEARGAVARQVAAPFSPPSLLQLHIAADGKASAAWVVDGRVEKIESVLVRLPGTVDSAGWEPADHAYVQAEVHAAMLAWLNALECPVVNRPSAESWYRRRRSLLSWWPDLRACGLDIPDTLITNEVADAQRFRQRLEAADVPGAVFKSFAHEQSWLVGPENWGGIAALQSHIPVCLTEPHGSPTLLCIVGKMIVWGAEPSAAELALSDRLLGFAARTGLTFVEVGLAQVRSGLAVVHVESLPMLEHFDPRAQARIIGGLTDLLAGSYSAETAEMLS